MTTLTLILTLGPRDAIIINEVPKTSSNLGTNDLAKKPITFPYPALRHKVLQLQICIICGSGKSLSCF